jgi:hypothetical protein
MLVVATLTLAGSIFAYYNIYRVNTITEIGTKTDQKGEHIIYPE